MQVLEVLAIPLPRGRRAVREMRGCCGINTAMRDEVLSYRKVIFTGIQTWSIRLIYVWDSRRDYL